MGYSSGISVVDLLHNIYAEDMDWRGAYGVFFLDLSKAFDSKDHKIFNVKLEALEFKESSSRCFCTPRTTSELGSLSDPKKHD